MTPPKKSSINMETESVISYELIQKHFNSYHNPGASDLNGNRVVEAEPSPDTVDTYYVDQDGQYYYKASSECEQVVKLEHPLVDTEIEETPQEVHINGGAVALVKTDGGNGNVNYFMLLPDDGHAQQPEQILSIGNNPSDSITIYNFEETGVRAKEEDDIVTTVYMGQSLKRHKGPPAEYKCDLCTYTSPRKYLLQRHSKSHSEDRPFTCKVCERGFKSAMAMKNHLNTHKGVKPHICTFCNSTFTTSGELVRHVRYKHTHEKPHKCTVCEYASVELSKLRRHMRCHTGERPYQCPQCSLAFTDMFKLKRHLRTHTGDRPYQCDECNMTFTQSNSLKTHKLIHNYNEKPSFPCELCPVSCGRMTDLRVHVKKFHTPSKPLKCSCCSKVFNDRYTFRLHKKSHAGEKCYKCAVCPYATTAPSNLKSHLLKHTNEKPFKCDRCDKSFRQKQLLRRHQNLRHNAQYVPPKPRQKCHQCHECHKQFAHRGNLVRHLAVHDPDDPDDPDRRTGQASEEPSEIHFEEEEEDDISPVVKVRVDPADTNFGKLVAISDTEDQLVVVQVIQSENGDHTQIHLVDPEDARDLTATVPSHDRDTTGTTRGDNYCFGFDVSE